MLKKIECFIQPCKLEEVKNALIEAGAEGITMSEVSGFGKQRGYISVDIPDKHVKFLPKVKLEIIVDEEILDNIINKIVHLSKTGEFGPGKIFILPVEDAIRIRTQESGINAIV